MNRQITGIIIALNEEKRIGAAVSSLLTCCFEVLVADTGSTDRTTEVAKSAGASVVHLTWEGYGPTRNRLTEMAATDWVFVLDADEVVDASLSDAVRTLQPKDGMVYAISRKNHLDGQWIRYCGWYPDWTKRIYHRKSVKWNNAKVHEQLIGKDEATAIRLPGHVLHYTYENENDYRAKTEQYAQLKAQKWLEEKRNNHFLLSFRPFVKWLRVYAWKAGFLAGKHGIVIANMNYYLEHQTVQAFRKLKSTA